MGKAEIKTGDRVYIGEQCALGCIKELRIRNRRGDDSVESVSSVEEEPTPVVIEDDCIVMNHVTIFEGSHIGSETFIQDYCRIGYDVDIGESVRVQYGAYICDRISVGADSIISGFVCDGTQIGEEATVMGVLVHEYAEPHRGWWESDEQPPKIKDNAVIGYNATIVGGVTIGNHSYIAANATVTEDVPPEHVVTGVNSHTHLSEWEGNELSDIIGEWTGSSQDQ